MREKINRNTSDGGWHECSFCGGVMEENKDISIEGPDGMEVCVERPCDRCAHKVVAQMIVDLSGALRRACSARDKWEGITRQIDGFIQMVRGESMKETLLWIECTSDDLDRPKK